MIIEELVSKNDEIAWDDFVARNDSATFFHQIAWKGLVEKCYKLRPIYLIAKDGGEVNGILPLFLVQNIFLGKRLISVPFSTVGGVCANSAKAKDMLIAKAIELTKALDCDYLELRNLEEDISGNLVKNPVYFTFQLQLNPNPETLWQNIDKTNRKKIKGVKEMISMLVWNPKTFEHFTGYIRKVREIWVHQSRIING